MATGSVERLTPSELADLDRLLAAPSVFAQTYGKDPAGFVCDCFTWPDGQGPATYQLRILDDLARYRRVAVRGPHGLGKSALASWIILWFATTRDPVIDWKVPVTASAWRQLSTFLMPEVRKWSRRLRWDRLGRKPFTQNELLQLNLKLERGEAFAMASDNAALLEGAHASAIAVVLDESKAIPDDTFDALEGALSTGDTYALSISTPGEPHGRFYDIHSRKRGYEDWRVRHVTLEEAIEAGRIGREWAVARLRQWGAESAVYINRVLGNFAAADSDGVIPLAWLEAANQRWSEWKEAGGRLDRLDAIGVDVARGGEDHSSLALRDGVICVEVRRETYSTDTMHLVGVVRGIQQAHGGRAVVDVIGVGGGPVDRLRELRADVEAFNASESSPLTDKSGELGFLNRRAEGWWSLRERLDPADNPTIAIPPDDQLTGDLTAPKWKVTSAGKIQIESKDELRKPERLGRSTDDGDAVVMAFAARPVPNIRFMAL